MGLFNKIKSRKERESALSPTEATEVQKPADSTPVGQMFPTEQPAQSAGQLDLGQMMGMFRDAAKSGNPQVAIGQAEVLNAQGTEMGDQIREVLKEHGIAANMQAGDAANITDPQEMQKQIMDVLSQNGIDVSKMMGGQSGFSVETGGDVDASPDS
ncbi:hypothetical protein BH10ACT11_BH10ACT11_08870 [soil metagenome]